MIASKTVQIKNGKYPRSKTISVVPLNIYDVMAARPSVKYDFFFILTFYFLVIETVRNSICFFFLLFMSVLNVAY